MFARPDRRDKGRAARAATLIATLLDQLSLTHPARTTARELEKLFTPKPVDPQVRALLERVPGATLKDKGERIGITKGKIWAIWHGHYLPNAELMAKIEAAAEEESVDA